MRRRTLLHALPTLLAAPALAQPAWAPDRPVRIIVAFPPGGSTDVVSRLIATPLFPDTRYWNSGTWRDHAGHDGIFRG